MIVMSIRLLQQLEKQLIKWPRSLMILQEYILMIGNFQEIKKMTVLILLERKNLKEIHAKS